MLYYRCALLRLHLMHIIQTTIFPSDNVYIMYNVHIYIYTYIVDLFIFVENVRHRDDSSHLNNKTLRLDMVGLNRT